MTAAPAGGEGDEDLAESYRRGGFTGDLGWGEHPALVVVDVARAYLEPTSPLYGGEALEAAVASARRVLDAARRAGIPVALTEVRYVPGGADGGVFFRKVPPLACFEEGNPLGLPVPGFEPLPGEVPVTKQYPSAFFGTSLASTLRAQGVDCVLIAGLTTSGCVRATALDAMQHGFIPVVVREAVGDRHPGPHEANLFDMQAKCADVRSEAEVLDHLAGLGRGRG